ncbi:MAG TPA: universal stress protein [Acidobacteriaceae bacterium]|nr:universal stress protein [Acidobacteriaceae bacterium]
MQKRVDGEFRKCMLAAPDRILVATDLTDLDYLVPHSIAQARVCGAMLTFVHVLPSARAAMPDAGAGYGTAYLKSDPAKLIRDARLVLLGVERQVEAHGITCETRVRQGSVTEALAREINQTEATRLIVGTHGRSKLGRLVMGSIANRLLTSIQIPVMVIGPQARSAEEHTAPRRILHPVSLMGIDHNSIHLPLNVAQSCRADLTLLHVIDPDLMEGMNPGRVIEWAAGRLRGMIPAADLMPAVHVRVNCGELAEEILRAAEQAGADLILLGSSGYSTRSFNESMAYKVLTAASCPVLTYHHEPYGAQIEALEAMHFRSSGDSYPQDAASRGVHSNGVHVS